MEMAMDWVQIKRDRRDAARREQILERLRAEYRESPCLRLTRPQVQRLLNLTPDVCARVLNALVAEGTLCPDDMGHFVRCDAAGATGRADGRR